MAATVRCPCSSSTSPITTLAPALAINRAVSPPMPRAAPEIRATLPSRRLMDVSLCSRTYGCSDPHRDAQVNRNGCFVLPLTHPVISVRVAHCPVAGQVPRAGEARPITLLSVQIAAHHRRPAGPQGELAFNHRLLHDHEAAAGIALHDGSLDPRQRLAHRS